MPSAADLTTRALGLLGVLEATETPSAADTALGLESLNGLLEHWGLQRQALAEVRREVFDLTASTASYTIGPGGAFNTAWPVWIERVSVISDGSEIPIGRPMTLGEWQGLSVKTATGAFPTAIYYDHACDANGRGLITVYPVPDSSSPDLVLYLPKDAVSTFASAMTEYAVPKGWSRALRYNLALELAPHYERQPSLWVISQAREALATIKRSHFRLRDAGFDPALSGTGGRFDIMAGE